MTGTDTLDRLTDWLTEMMPEASDVRLDGLDRVEFGHSSETLLLGLSWRADGVAWHRDVVLRVRPPAPGLLPPYDLSRQFEILRRLEATPVRAPAALWLEGTGDVLGREFYVMERLGGTVYEQNAPEELGADPERVRRMTESLIDQLAAIHTVDLRATGLDTMAAGNDYLSSELRHWQDEVHRVQRGPLPALERLVEALRERQPDTGARATLVHGDAKPGNFAFEGDEVSAVLDWEMATVGDPLADLGWLELVWGFPGGVTRLPGALTVDEAVVRYQASTGIEPRERAWYRAFQGLKMAVIMLVGAMLCDAGHSDDRRFVRMGPAVHHMTQKALVELGLDPDVEPGPVTVSEERVAALRALRAGVR